ncbi:MAG: phenylalanine--tRNA ligase subunit beta [Candidatus Berkelbacteria bacterium]|nr:phenylalanine--tRNA ligase subunit beta [Candidatus Berkelbacteria bacterium]
MKVLKSWLKDYINCEISDEKLVDILTSAGLEVEEIASGIDPLVIVAEIKEIKKHPDADKLRIAMVNTGANDLQIVCGAANIEVGQRVPLAFPGSLLPAGEIKVSKIRGVESNGMLCAEDELGIGEDHKGIFILPSEYEIGKPLADYIGSDTVIELDITANRGDCLSHIGVAREIAAFENSSVKKEPIALSKTDSAHASTKISVEIKNPELCPQYLSRIIAGVKIGPSPKWMQDRLIACGAKPINNVVDVTNYILLDLGHPMHAFDWKKLSGSKIIVRNAKKNEDIVMLDGEIRNLDPEMLVISDNEKAVAIAGIMGGKNSEVDESTETIVLEAAEFDRKSIRRTAKTLNLATEASYRFERGIDSGAIEYAINKAADLIAKTAGGKVMQGIVQSGQRPEKTGIRIERDKICQLLGEKIAFEEIDHILRHLGFVISGEFATVPTWRHDISIWQDLAEEVGRVRGYDKIRPIALPKIKGFTKQPYYLVEHIKDLLLVSGYTETMNYPFLSEADLAAARLDAGSLLEVANPMQPENKYLRTSLIPGLLKNIAKNPSFDPIQIFEIGHVYSKTKENIYLAIATAGKSTAEHDQLVGNIMSALNTETGARHSEFSRDDLQKYKIKKPKVLVSEMNLSKIIDTIKIDQQIGFKINKDTIVYRGVSKFPAVTRDLAFIVDTAIKSEDVSNQIYASSDLINRVELFDEFTSDKFGVGKKNIAYHIYLQSTERTLTDAEALTVTNEIIMNIEKNFKAKLRKV